ncbi:hypothetical protein AAC387_Pa03g0467 [Persea americana]
MFPWALIKRSPPSVLLKAGIQRQTLRPLSQASSPGSSPTFQDSNSNERRESSSSSSSSSSSAFLKSVSGAVAGSSLGLLVWWSSSSPAESSLAFADRTVVDADTSVNQEQSSSLPESPPQEKKPKYLFRDSYRRKVFFNYEKRIRMRSPPEKVFEYFASYRSPDGEVFMTPADLMRAIVPVFPPSESDIVREGSLRGEKFQGKLHCADSSFFMLFDTNNDGLISFSEYIFFVTLLSIPESSFTIAFKMFDLDHNGEIELDEFKKVMALMRSYNRQGSSHKDGKRHGLKVGTSVENGGLLEYFFGKDGTKCLQHGKFVKFLKDLHDEILRLEFTHYDFKLQGTISAKDFALSMVASADINQINRFLDRVDELDNYPHLQDKRFTLEEFKAFAELRKRLQPLALAIFSYGKVNGLLTKKDFQHAATHVCGISLTDNVVDLIFHVFDTNLDGNLSSEEFLGVLQKREKDIAQPTQVGIAGLISCWWNCAKTCSFTRLIH